MRALASQPLTDEQKRRRAIIEAPFPTFNIIQPKIWGGRYVGDKELPTEGRRVWPSGRAWDESGILYGRED
jgi:hypothetical protein